MKHEFGFVRMVASPGWAYVLLAWLCQSVLAAGTWQQLSANAPDNVNLMLLLPDGRVMAAHNDAEGSAYSDWYALVPDSDGHYASGSWSNLSSMHCTRYSYGSQVLPSGKVFVAGGEYGTGAASAELYDPLTDHWKLLSAPINVVNPPYGKFSDSASMLLPDGSVLIHPVKADSFGSLGLTFIYSPDTDSWSSAIPTQAPQDENSWVKLPDGSILTIDPIVTSTNGVSTGGIYSERFIPSLQAWVPDAAAPVQMYEPLTGIYGETGAGLLLPNGKAFFLGGSGRTAIYTPSGSTNNGKWAVGPDIPAGLVAADAPAAMLPNGRVLCAFGSPPYLDSDGNQHFDGPTSFYEFDYTDHKQSPEGSFNQVDSPTGGRTDSSSMNRAAMLVLPDGNILYSHQGNDLYVYYPGGTPVPSGKPSIDSVQMNPNGSYHLTGKGLNGICAGAVYGDDLQMDSNYPLVQLTDAHGHVSYARSHDWSSTGVMTGNATVTTEFTLTTQLPGTYSLVVVANGISSDPVTFDPTVWVDFNYQDSPRSGTYSNPFKTLADGVGAVLRGGTIAFKAIIQPSLSHETMTISKPMTLISVGGPASIGEQ